MAVPLSLRARLAVADVTDRMPVPAARPFADPPPGSNLKPIIGEPGLPLIGNTFPVLQKTVERSRVQYEKYGEVSWSNLLRDDYVVVLGPEAITEVLANRDDAFSSKLGWEQVIGAFFERGLMLMDGDEHLHHRRIMQQAFKRERLEAYLERMNAVIARELREWRPSGEFEFYMAIKQMTLNIATEVFMGEQLGAGADKLNRAFIDLVAGGQAMIRSDVPGGKWHRGLVGRKLLSDYFHAQLPAKRAGDGDDLFSVLCHAETEDGDRFTDDDVVNHMIFAMMAAHDTSTITLSMLAYHLAKNPEWQDRVREESIALGKPAIDFGDLEALTAMDQAFKETLRINAPAGILGRQAVKDTEILGHYVPAGSGILLGMYPTHRMEPWWNDPDTFDPGRFSPERAEDKRFKNAWMPFGSHMHKCLGMHFGGMEIKAILHQLLLRNRIEVDPGYEPVIDYGTGPYPGDGLPLRLTES